MAQFDAVAGGIADLRPGIGLAESWTPDNVDAFGLQIIGGFLHVVDFCRDDGLIVGRSGGGQRYSNTLTLSPHPVITRGEIARIVEMLYRAIAVIPAAM